jgi:hypothetical protein
MEVNAGNYGGVMWAARQGNNKNGVGKQRRRNSKSRDLMGKYSSLITIRFVDTWYQAGILLTY